MELDPDLAEKILKADTRNHIQKLTDGGTLTSAAREKIEAAAISPEMVQQARVSALIQKWTNAGRLTAGELDEIRALYPNFATGSQQPPTPESETESSEPFVLNGAPERIPLTKDQMARWEQVYGTAKRQIRRWHTEGVEKNDPCPLDTPHLMPEWWARRMKWRVPEKILLAAKANAPAPPSPSEAQTGCSIPTEQSEKLEQASDLPDPPPSAPPISPLDLGDFQLVEGDQVKQARALVAVAYSQLEKAYRGAGGDIELLHRKHERAMIALNKAEAADRQYKKDHGLLIARDVVDRDLAQAAEMLRQMRDSMVRRVLELCPQLPAEHRIAVSDAINRVRAQEDRALSLKSIDDFNGLFKN